MSFRISQKFLGIAELYNVPVRSGKKAINPFQYCRVVIKQADCRGRVKQSELKIDPLLLA